MAQDTQLRRAVQSAGGQYRVVKNTLAEQRRSRNVGRRLAQRAFGHELNLVHATDPVSLAKALTQDRQGCAGVQFQGGSGRRARLIIAEIQQLALLPSKEELIGKIMFLLQSPAQRLARPPLAGVTRNLAVVVQEAVKAEKFAH